MFETGMPCARPDPRHEAELLDAIEPEKRSGAKQRGSLSRQRNQIVEAVANDGFSCQSECVGCHVGMVSRDGSRRPAGSCTVVKVVGSPVLALVIRVHYRFGRPVA